MVKARLSRQARVEIAKTKLREAFLAGAQWDPGPGREDATMEAQDDAFEHWFRSKSRMWRVTHVMDDGLGEGHDNPITKVRYFDTEELKERVVEVLDDDDMMGYSIEVNPDYTGGF